MIEIRELIKSYGGREILNIKNFKFFRGKIYSLMGGNGCGKSSLMKIIYGIVEKNRGEILKDGTLSYNPQKEVFLQGTVKYNLVEPFKLRGLKPPYIEIERYLDLMELKKIEDSKVETLSGGERAKLQFIRTVLYNSDFILLDEVTSSMDKKSTALVERILLEKKREGKGIILITHDYLQAKRVSDEILEIENSEIIKIQEG